MQPRWFYAALAFAICLLLVAILVPAQRQDVALLERLAPRIERAQMLTPETRDTIMQLVDRARDTTGDPRHHERRQNAIQRVTDALNARTNAGNIGQGTPELSPTLTSSP